jgi:hypothetical protein
VYAKAVITDTARVDSHPVSADGARYGPRDVRPRRCISAACLAFDRCARTHKPHLPPIRSPSSPLTEPFTERVIDTHHHRSCGVVGRVLMGLLATASSRFLPSPPSSPSKWLE